MSVAIIVNPLSGGASVAQGKARAELALRILDQSGERGDVFVTERRGHARELALSALGRGARLLIAWGGDGTINEVGSALVGGEAALGIVPSGSGNGLARELRVDRRAEHAIVNAIRATPQRIDAGELGGRLFFNMAGIGFDAHISTCFDRDRRGKRGLATYARLTLREMWGYQAGNYRFGETLIRRALLVTLANSSQFGNGARIAPAAKLNDGRLELVVFEESSRLAAIAAIPRLFLGNFDRAKGVTIRQITGGRIESERPMIFHVDGEPAEGGTQLEVRVHPAALPVAVR